MADPTPLLGLDRDNTRIALNKLDLMGGLLGSFAPDMDTIVASTRTFGYRGARFRDGLGGVTFEPDGTIVCTDDAVSYVQYDTVGGVTIASTLDEAKYAIAEVTCASGAITHIEDLRDLNLHDVPGLYLDDLLDVEIYDPLEDDQLRYDATAGLWVNRPMSATGTLDVEDEGSLEEANVTRLNFTGAGATAVGDGVGGVDVNIPGIASGDDIDLIDVGRPWRAVWPTLGSTTPNFFGTGPNHTINGTAAIGTLATTNFRTSRARLQYTSPAAPNNGSGFIGQALHAYFTLGDSAGVGGFIAAIEFAIVTLPASTRAFYGMTGDTMAVVTGGEPSSRIDIIGFGWDTGDTNWQFYTNDGTGTITRVNTGDAIATDVVYRVVISCDDNSSNVSCKLYSVAFAGLTLLDERNPTSELPDGSVFLSTVGHINTSAGSSAIVSDFMFWRGIQK